MGHLLLSVDGFFCTVRIQTPRLIRAVVSHLPTPEDLMIADTTKKRIDELAREFADATDPIALNMIAFQASEIFVRLRRDHAAQEAQRKVLQLEIRDEIMTPATPGGSAPKKTEAEELARTRPAYLAHLEQLQELELWRERALTIYHVAKQRAGLLARAQLGDLPEPEQWSSASEGAAAAAAGVGGL